MCLFTKQKRPKIAKEDIKVYKVLMYEGNQRFVTPYIGTPVKIGKFMKAARPNYEPLPYWSSPLKQFFSPGYKIEFQGIHAFRDKKSAIECAIDCDDSACVFECVIPKGTKYWVGLCNDIASHKLKVVRELSYYEYTHEEENETFWERLKKYIIG